MEDDIDIPGVIYIHTPAGLTTKYKDQTAKKDPRWVEKSITFIPENNSYEINSHLQRRGVTIKEGELYVNDLEEPAIRKQDILDILAKSTNGDVFLTATKKFCSTCHTTMYWKTCHTSMPLHKGNLQSNASIHQLITDESHSLINLVLTYDQSSTVSSELVDDLFIIKDNSEMAGRHEIRLKNNSGHSVIIKRVVVDNSEVADSLFTETNGQVAGHMITYDFGEECIHPTESSLHCIELLVKAKVTSSDHKITIITSRNGVEQKVPKQLSVFKLYNNRSYDTETNPRISNDWITNNQEISESVGLNHSSYICKNVMESDIRLQKLIFELNVGLERVAQGHQMNVSYAALKLYQDLKEPLNRNNFLYNSTVFTLSEMYHYMQTQTTTNTEVVGVTPTDSGDMIAVDVNFKDAGKMNIQVGDQILIKPFPADQPEIVLIGELDCKEPKRLLIKLAVCNLVKANSIIAICTKIRKQPFLVTLHSLQIMRDNLAIHNSVLKYLLPLPGDVKTPKVYPEIDCPNKKLNAEQVTTFQKIANLVPGDPGLCLRGAAGTGKTNVIAEAVYKDVSDGYIVLIVCPTNNGMNDVQERVTKRLADLNVKIVKLGSKNTPVTDFCYMNCTEELTNGQRGHKTPTSGKVLGGTVIITTLHNSIRLNCILHHNARKDKIVQRMYIDEASYPLLTTLIIPLVSQLRAGNSEFKLVLIGDENQIQLTPRSLLSRECNAEANDILSRSIRSETYNKNVNPQMSHFLTDNYRNPKLITEEMNLLCYRRLRCHSELEGNISFYHVDTSYNNVRDFSRYSIPESELTLEIAGRYRNEKVACIAYYASHRSITFIEAYNNQIYGPSFSTCETVQGQECDHAIVALCCHKPNNTWHNDRKRLNVCLSRGKKSVSFITNLFNLSRTTLFKPLMKRAMARGQILVDERMLSILRANLRIEEKAVSK